MSDRKELNRINSIAAQRQLSPEEELYRCQLSAQRKVNKKSSNIDDVVKRVDELEKQNLRLRERLKIVELTLSENGIYL